MASLILETRPSDHFELLEEVPTEDAENVYALALLHTPSFPGDHHPEGEPFAVVCALQYVTDDGECAGEYLWGWVHLGPETKEELGSMMKDGGADCNRWYYLRITSVGKSND